MYRSASAVMETRVEAFVHLGDERFDVIETFLKTTSNLPLSVSSVRDKGTHISLRVFDACAVIGPIPFFIARQQFLKRADVISHMAVRIGDDRGRPTHHLIAAKQDILFFERIAKVIGGMARRVNGFQRPAFTPDDIAIFELNVRLIIKVAGACADGQPSVRAVLAVAESGGAGRRLQ